MNLSPFQNYLFNEIYTNPNKPELKEVIYFPYKFNFLNFFVETTIGSGIIIYLIYDSFINLNKSIFKYISAYFLLNSIIYNIYFAYEYNDVVNGDLLEKIMFIIGYLGIYFSIKEICGKFLLENKKTISIIKYELGQIFLLIFISFLHVKRISFLKTKKLKKFHKILKNNSDKNGYINNKKTREILSFISM